MNNPFRRTRQLPIGALVLSIDGEQDTDDGNVERYTGTMAWGCIDSAYVDLKGVTLYGVSFPNGTRVLLDHAELELHVNYRLITPDQMARRLHCALAYDQQMTARGAPPAGDDYEVLLNMIGCKP